jgi:hypothetical protein
VVLATSAPEDELSILRELLDSEDIVSTITSSDDVETAKPEPAIVEIALRRAGVSASRAVFVGDSLWWGRRPAGVVLFAVAGIAALFCNIASSAGFALIVPDRRQLVDEHLVDEPLELREHAVEAVAHLHVRSHRAERHLQLVRRARMPAARSSDRCTPCNRGSEFLSFLRKIDATWTLT